jgi:hypothetical protein
MRKYKVEDIREYLGLGSKFKFPKSLYTQGKKGSKDIYTDEFQSWFAGGLRRCEEHAYPVSWHIMQGLHCPQCNRGTPTS